jgi:uncharacterized membrane protein YqjE
VADGGIPEKPVGDLVNEVSTNIATLVREEIELAKAEIEVKTRRLLQGTVVGAVAGFFLFFALVFLLDSLAWGLVDAFNDGIWLGFLVTAAILVIVGVLAGLLAYRAIKAGTPPTPQQAIEEARLIKQTLEHPEIEAARARANGNS